MARKHYVGECIVWMNRGCYNVNLIESVNENCYTTSASSKVFMTNNRFEAHQIQYMINGWGLAEFTIGNTQRQHVLAALDILDRHSFNRDNGSERKRKFCEMYAKANAECFKAILAKIESVTSREALRKLWMSKYQKSNGEMTEDNYNVVNRELRKVALAA